MRRLTMVLGLAIAAACSGPAPNEPAVVTGHYAMVSADGRPLPTELLPGFRLTRGTLDVRADQSFTYFTEYNEGAASRTAVGEWSRSGNVVSFVGHDGYRFTAVATDRRTLVNDGTGDFMGYPASGQYPASDGTRVVYRS